MFFFSNELFLCVLRFSLVVYIDKVKFLFNKVVIEYILGLMFMKVKFVMYWRKDKYIWSIVGIVDGVCRRNVCVLMMVVVKKIDR